MPTIGEIHYYASRRGRFNRPAVVYIHGAGGNNRQWPFSLRTLPGYRIFAIDLPGHGNSEGTGQQSVEAYARMVSRWLLDVGLSRAVMVGHSMGGAIALQLALDHADQVAGLVLAGSGARLRVSPEILEGLSSDITHSQTVDRLVKLHFTDASQKDLPIKLRVDLMDCRRSVLLGDYQACDGFDVIERLGQIDIPTCVLCGEQDVLTPPKYARYLADNIPGTELTLLPNAGHMLTWEETRRVTETIVSFLSSIH